MPWRIELKQGDETIQLEDSKGDMAYLEVSKNLSKYMTQAFSGRGLYWLDNQPAGKTIETIRQGVKILGTKKHADEVEVSPGNAGRVLAELLRWAIGYPDAIWRVS